VIGIATEQYVRGEGFSLDVAHLICTFQSGARSSRKSLRECNATSATLLAPGKLLRLRTSIRVEIGLASTRQAAYPFPHFLVARMRVHRRREWRQVPREPLCQGEVPRQSAVDCDSHAPEGVESLQEGESRGSPLGGTGPATSDFPPTSHGDPRRYSRPRRWKTRPRSALSARAPAVATGAVARACA